MWLIKKRNRKMIEMLRIKVIIPSLLESPIMKARTMIALFGVA